MYHHDVVVRLSQNITPRYHYPLYCFSSFYIPVYVFSFCNFSYSLKPSRAHEIFIGINFFNGFSVLLAPQQFQCCTLGLLYFSVGLTLSLSLSLKKMILAIITAANNSNILFRQFPHAAYLIFLPTAFEHIVHLPCRTPIVSLLNYVQKRSIRKAKPQSVGICFFVGRAKIGCMMHLRQHSSRQCSLNFLRFHRFFIAHIKMWYKI